VQSQALRQRALETRQRHRPVLAEGTDRRCTARVVSLTSVFAPVRTLANVPTRNTSNYTKSEKKRYELAGPGGAEFVGLRMPQLHVRRKSTHRQ